MENQSNDDLHLASVRLSPRDRQRVRRRGGVFYLCDPIDEQRARQARSADMRYIRFNGRRYTVVVKGKRLPGLFSSREDARQARDKYLAWLRILGDN